MQVNANAGCVARAHVTRVSAIRAHAQCLPLAVFVFLFALFVAKVAYADDWYNVLYRSNLDGSEQYIVSADDKWQAAAIICGKSKSFIDGLDDATRKKLATNGGSFQTLAESLDNDWPAWNEDTLSQSLSETFGGDGPDSLWRRMTNPTTIVPTYPFVGFNPDALSPVMVRVWQDTCPTSIFAINANSNLRAAAIEALNLIVNGGSIPSGGTGNFSDVNTFTLYHDIHSSRNPAYYLVGDTRYYLGGNKDHYMPDNLTVTFSGMQINGLPALTEGQYYYCYSMTSGYVTVYASSEPFYVYSTTTDDFGVEVVTHAKTNAEKIYYARVSSSYSYDGGTTMTRTFDDAFNMTEWGSDYVQWSLGMYQSINADVGSGGGGGDDEPNPWPTPVPPEQPNVPEPPDFSPPPITGPVFPTDPPQDPTVTPEPEPTGTDYTTYLKAIIRQLNKVIDEMSNHCKHIRDQISTSANAIISNLHTYINDLREAIDTNFSTLNDYLEDLTKWYERFVNDVISDLKNELKTIQSILRQILRKIGIGRGTQKDVEKDVDDGFNFLEWLINFITSKLSGVIGDFVGDVGGLIAGVKDKFPFSIPWDIAAILALLDGVPTTPVFTITIPAINGWWQETRFVIDLHSYDSVASAARIMINAWWVLVLAMKTNWLLMIMGDSTSIGERIANRMTGGE